MVNQFTANIYFTVQENKSVVYFFIEGYSNLFFPPPLEINIGLPKLASMISKLTNAVPSEDSNIWGTLPNPFEPENNYAKERFKKCLEKVVTVGSNLYKDLKSTGMDMVLEKINSLPEGSKVNIITNHAFFPWEILYPLDYDETWPTSAKSEAPLNYKLFWGYKFIISYILMSEESQVWEPATEEHKKALVSISINLNPKIEQAFNGKPFKPISHHKEFYELHINVNKQLRETADEIKDFLLSNNEATFIYFYCHGSNEEPFSSKCVEKLELGNNDFIQPRFLNHPKNYKYGGYPIIFLNSCNSAAQSPLSFTSFHKEFRRKGAIGIIGTNIQIPTTFAAVFGTKIIEGYLQGQQLGVIFYRLRRELLEKDNPLGLFYSLQCPWDVMKGNSTI